MCHNGPSIISRESMHKHNFGQTMKLQSTVVTLNVRSLKFSVFKQCIYASLVQTVLLSTQNTSFGRETKKNCQLHTLILRPGYDSCWCLDPDFNVCAINVTSLGPANLDDPSKNSEILFCKLFRMCLRICICPPYCCCTIHQV